MELAALFRGTGGTGMDYTRPDDIGMQYMQDGSAFLENFETPFTSANVGGPILNADANLLPTRADEYRDIANTLDYRLGDGLGVARFARKNDSVGGNAPDGMYGAAEPSKMFGRDSRTPDLNYERENMLERARAGFKKMGFKNAETPAEAQFQPWQWNDVAAMGIGGPPANPNQYNRNYAPPDADAVARRSYQPAPSRLSKMLATDVEVAALRPQRTLLDPLKVVSEDRTRMALTRIPRNADVTEAVLYENIVPRGFASRVEAPRAYADADALRRPVGTNDTADRSVFGRWNVGLSEPLHVVQNEDRARAARFDFVGVRGHDPSAEIRQFAAARQKLDAQAVADPTRVRPDAGELAAPLRSR
jgi:hypothetical protein